MSEVPSILFPPRVSPLRAKARRSTRSSAAFCSAYCASPSVPFSRSVSSANSSSFSACNSVPLPEAGSGTGNAAVPAIAPGDMAGAAPATAAAGFAFSITPAPAARANPSAPRIHHRYFAHGSSSASESKGLFSPTPGFESARCRALASEGVRSPLALPALAPLAPLASRPALARVVYLRIPRHLPGTPDGKVQRLVRPHILRNECLRA